MTETGHNSTVTIDPNELRGVLDDLANSQRAVSEATGKLRSKLKGILDDTGWHKGALQTAKMIDNMSDTSRADFLRSFTPMFETLMAEKWEAEMADIFDGAEAKEAAE